ncbi:MAG: alcohol dehydrogenase catalytic domain-containing protein [Endomicrobium sp.]|nr:alcohol dehydrogenase catalytic domain-containing protein [Endomicrobium sp.]
MREILLQGAIDEQSCETIIPCLECVFCKKGHNNLCLKWKHLGMNVDGTFAEYIVIPASIVHKKEKEFLLWKILQIGTLKSQLKMNMLWLWMN